MLSLLLISHDTGKEAFWKHSFSNNVFFYMKETRLDCETQMPHDFTDDLDFWYYQMCIDEMCLYTKYEPCN